MTAIIGRQIIEGAAGLTHAIKYCRAAQTEEKNGFAYTAAVEWQKAAELLSPIPFLADRCWLQWERIMQLPRRLAGPISEVQAPSAAQIDSVRQAANSGIELDEFAARLAADLFSDNEFEQTGGDILTVSEAQYMAAAA